MTAGEVWGRRMSYNFIFGTGRVLENQIVDVPLQRITAFVDNDAKKWGNEFHGRKIISPGELRTMKPHRVYISTAKYFDEIYEQLIVECGIAREKIKGFHCLLPLKEDSFDGRRKIGDYWKIVKDIAASLKSIGAMSVYDSDDGLRDYGVLSPYDDRLSAWRRAGRWNLVRDVAKECPDTVLFVDPLEKMSVNALAERIHTALRRWDCSCVIEACGSWDRESETWIRQLKKIFPDIIIQQHASCVVVIVSHKRRFAGAMIVVTHKPFVFPYGVGDETGYEAIFAGAQGKESVDGLRDDAGDHISYLNEKINECTAIYWTWKHRPQPMVGFCHYRRYFLDNEVEGRKRILTAGETWRYLQDADILVANPVLSGKDDIIGIVRNSTQQEAFAYGWEIIRRMFEKYHPEDVQLLEDVMHGREMYPCNMFVTRWEIFDAYCTWLFSFLIPAAEEADVSRFDDYSKRIIGFFAERMLTVWLVKHPELRIKTLPILQTDA